MDAVLSQLFEKSHTTWHEERFSCPSQSIAIFDIVSIYPQPRLAQNCRLYGFLVPDLSMRMILSLEKKVWFWRHAGNEIA